MTRAVTGVLADLELIRRLLEPAHAMGWWPGRGATYQSYIGSTKGHRGSDPEPGWEEGPGSWLNVQQELWQADNCAARLCASTGIVHFPIEPPERTAAVDQVMRMVAGLHQTLSWFTWLPPAEGDVYEIAGHIDDALSALRDMVDTRAIPIRRCSREDCHGEDGLPRPMGGRAGDVCAACAKRDERTRNRLARDIGRRTDHPAAAWKPIVAELIRRRCDPDAIVDLCERIGSPDQVEEAVNA